MPNDTSLGHAPLSVTPRLRAYLLGLACVPPVCWWGMRNELLYGGSELIESSLLPIVVFLLFVLVLVNDLLRRFLPRFALTRAELLIVYVMQTTTVGLAGLGQMQFLSQALAGAYGFATPANDWEGLFHRFIPRGWTPDPAVLDAYYKGNSTFFTPAHILGWLVPIIVWSGFILTLIFTFLCLNTLLRKHWMEAERLPFPMVQLPLEMTEAGTTRSLLGQRLFWAAFLLTCAFRSMSAVERVEPSLSFPIPFGYKGQLIDLEPFFATGHPWNQIGYFRLSFHPMIIGITYFLPLDVSFSSWFFYLIVKAENVVSAAFGFRGGANPATGEIPYTAEQGAGAFLAIALFSLWGARRHLSEVWRTAFGLSSSAGISDVEEPLSYRTACYGLIGAFVALVLFAMWGGIPWYAASGFFLLYLLMIVTVTRLRAEAGPMLNYGPIMHPLRMLIELPGARAWDERTLTAMSYFRWFDTDYRTVAMPPQMEALKMAEQTGMPPRRLGRWILLASAVAVVACFVSVLSIYYDSGALNPRGDNGWRTENGRMPFRALEDYLKNPRPPSGVRLGWISLGFALTSLLIKARTLFLWWPLHPSGFALAHAGAAMQWVWTATLFGWLAKALLLRYGGIQAFKAGIPFFLGLILGDIVIACLWSLLGVFLDTQMYMFFPG